jgi:hypothetical protein
VNLRNSGTSIVAYRDLKLAQEQRRATDWVWAQGERGSTQYEAEQALRSRHAQKRFAEIENAWFIRKTGATRLNPRSGKQNEVYIGTPTVRRALSNDHFLAHFQRVRDAEDQIALLEMELRAAIKAREAARRDVYAEVLRVYGPDWQEAA